MFLTFTRIVFFITVLFSIADAQVRTGLDNLVVHKYDELKGKKIGFITNKTSVTSSGEFAVNLFTRQKTFKLVALFSPEHGLFGERKAGMKSDADEKYQGIPVYSLYGTTRKPTKTMLKGIDALVFDIQDIGVRPYTYLSTMIYAMEAAAENKIEFIVLDRPNPLSGDRIEGNVLDSSLKSFVGAISIPYLHGMTLGELAKMAKGEKWFHGAEKLKLTVLKMSDWYRSMYWNETGLKWKSPSPNIPTYESAVGCAMFGAIGELGIVSVGIGSDLPFMRIGSKLVQPEILEQDLSTVLPKGISAAREDYTVPYGDSSKTFYGMKITFPGDLKNAGELYGPEFRLLKSLLADSVFLKSYRLLPLSTKKMFQKVTGTTEVMRAFESGEGLESVLSEGKKNAANFRIKRRKYLIYQ